MTLAASVLVLLLVPASCATRAVRRVKCADGLPVRLLLDEACPPDGVCGYTCAPGRWRPAARDDHDTIRVGGLPPAMRGLC